MFSNFDSDDRANLGRIVGIAMFVIAFLLPGVHDGPVSYTGFVCAWWTLTGTASFIASLLGPDRANGFALFFMISGWITPLVVIGILIKSDKVKRGIARALPVLLVVPWIVFAWPQSGWGATTINPSFGHYIWTVGCLLIFTPEYVYLSSSLKNVKDLETD